MNSEILLSRTSISKLMARKDDPETNNGAGTYPSMDSPIFVVH